MPKHTMIPSMDSEIHIPITAHFKQKCDTYTQDPFAAESRCQSHYEGIISSAHAQLGPR